MASVSEQQQPVSERRKRIVILGICSMSLLIVGLAKEEMLVEIDCIACISGD